MRRLLHWLVAVVLAAMGGCASSPKAPPGVGDGQQKLVGYALSLQGVPYRFGGDSPASGFDCSGLVRHIFLQHGVSLPRTVRAMAERLPVISANQRQPGDLVFFRGGDAAYSHVGILVGPNAFVHAPSTRTGHVMISSLEQSYWSSHFAGLRRVWFGTP